MAVIDTQKKGRPVSPPLKLEKIPSDPRKRWEWIKYQLRIKGYSIAEVARMNGVHRSTVHVMYRVNYPRMQAAVASMLGYRPEQIWPERYTSSLKRHDTNNSLVVNG